MDKDLNNQDKKKNKAPKRIFYSLIFVFILIGIVLFAAPMILKNVIESQLHKRGFSEFQIGKLSLNTKSIEFNDIKITDKDIISRIKIIPDYKNKQIKELIIAKADINTYLSNDNIKIIDQTISFKSENSDKTPLNIPIDIIQILDSNLSLFSQFGNFKFNITSLIEKSDDNSFNIKSSVKNNHENLSTDIKLSGEVKDNFEYNIVSNIKKLDLNLFGIEVKDSSGQFLLSNSAQSADLKFKELNLLEIPFENIKLKYHGDNKEQQLKSSGVTDNSSFNIDLNLAKAEDEMLKLQGKIELIATNLENIKQEFAKDLSGDIDLKLNINGLQEMTANAQDWKELSGDISLKTNNLSIQNYIKKANISSKFKFSQKDNIIELKSNDNIDFVGSIQGKTIKTTIKSSKSSIIAKLIDKEKIQIKLPVGLELYHGKDQIKYNGKIDINSDIEFKKITFKTDAGDLFAKYDRYKIDSDSFNIKGDLKNLAVINSTINANNIMINGVDVKLPKFNSNIKLSGDLNKQIKLNGKAVIKNKVNISFNGKHNVKSNKGDVNLDIEEFTFNNNIQPDDLLPMLKNKVNNAKGSFGYRGNIAWNKNKIDGKGDLLLKSFSIDTDDISLKNINTVAKISDISPITINKQDISIESFGEDFPFGNVLMNISLKDKDLTVNKASLEIAGGTIKSRPFKMNLDKPNTEIILEIDALNLQNIFEIATLKGVTASGFVTGTIPLTIRDDLSFALHDGLLTSPQGGLIEYSVDSMPEFLKNADNENITYLRTVLESFNYKDLQLKIDDDLIGQKIELKASGHNPDFFDGREVKLNLVLEGSLQNVIKYNLGAYKLPDTINKQIKNYESKKNEN